MERFSNSLEVLDLQIQIKLDGSNDADGAKLWLLSTKNIYIK